MLGDSAREVTGLPTCSACRQYALGMSQTRSVQSIAALTTSLESELMHASASLSECPLNCLTCTRCGMEREPRVEHTCGRDCCME